jgi:serine O-acetyltransferase
MNLRKIRSLMRLSASLLFGILYIPHLILGGGDCVIISDLRKLEYQIGIKLPLILQLLYHLHNNRYYRNVFYHRLGPINFRMVQTVRQIF